MKGQDLRPWLVQDPTWTRTPSAPPEEAATARMDLDGVERLLQSAATAGDSAYIGICFDFESPR